MNTRRMTLIAAAWLLLFTGCDNQRQLRETLTARVFELGYIEGEIFTLTIAIRGLIGDYDFDETTLDAVIRQSWESSDKFTTMAVCDSLGVVFDLALSNTLLLIYREAYLLGVEEGVEVALKELSEESDTAVAAADSSVSDTSGRSGFSDSAELEKARAAFEEVRHKLLGWIEGIELERTKPKKP